MPSITPTARQKLDDLLGPDNTPDRGRKRRNSFSAEIAEARWAVAERAEKAAAASPAPDHLVLIERITTCFGCGDETIAPEGLYVALFRGRRSPVRHLTRAESAPASYGLPVYHEYITSETPACGRCCDTVGPASTRQPKALDPLPSARTTDPLEAFLEEFQ